MHLAVVVCSAKGRPGQVCTWRMPGTSVAGTGRTDCWELMGGGRVYKWSHDMGVGRQFRMGGGGTCILDWANV